MSEKRRNFPARRQAAHPEKSSLVSQLWTHKRRLLLEHFLDTVVLVFFEGAIVFAFDYLGRFLSLGIQLIHWVHLITTWTCIFTLMLF